MIQQTNQQAPAPDTAEVAAPVSTDATLAVTDVRFEHLREALGIGTSQPRLSWLVDTERPGWLQAAYEIEAIGPGGQMRGHTGRVEFGRSTLVPWPFAPLSSRECLSVRVRVWGTDGSASDWSDLYSVEAGLLRPNDWSALFIRPGWEEDSSPLQPSPMLRREFSVKAGLVRARLYVTALGVYEAQINGMPVGDHVLAPGWTSYNHRLRYQTFDVTDLLREGAQRHRRHAGRRLVSRATELRRRAAATSTATAWRCWPSSRSTTPTARPSASSPTKTWRAAPGPILASEHLRRRDLRRPAGAARLVAARLRRRRLGGRATDRPRPRARSSRRSGRPCAASSCSRRSPSPHRRPAARIVDFGQNLVGRLRLTVQGPAGHDDHPAPRRGAGGRRAVHPAAAHGAGHRPLHPARRRTGDLGAALHLPRLPLRRGRRLAGRAADRTTSSAVVCHSDMERTGWFECSDPLVNRLHENVVWSMRGNFLDVPTDCPQRDERLGWTGDIQVFAPDRQLPLRHAPAS